MLEFRRHRRSEIGIDMTPMIDCVFQLLIFFLLSSSFLTPAVRLNLPRASADRAEKVETIVVSLDASGQLLLDREPIGRETLRERLRARFQNTTQRLVTLRADRALPYEKVLGVLVVIQQAGASQVRLAHEAREKSP